MKHNKEQIEARSKKFHQNIIQFAIQNPEWKVVIKTKTAEQYLRYVLDLLEEVRPEGHPPNMNITNDKNATDLIFQSRIVLGFNSTVLFEALFAKKPVITPSFEDLFSHDEWDNFSGYQNIVNYANTYDELLKAIKTGEGKLERNEKDRISFLKKWNFYTDGNSCMRAEQEILKAVEGKSVRK